MWHDILYRNTVTNIKHRSVTALTKDTPKCTLLGELWGVYLRWVFWGWIRWLTALLWHCNVCFCFFVWIMSCQYCPHCASHASPSYHNTNLDNCIMICHDIRGNFGSLHFYYATQHSQASENDIAHNDKCGTKSYFEPTKDTHIYGQTISHIWTTLRYHTSGQHFGWGQD